MHEVASDPVFLCAAAWLVSRLQIVWEVHRRIGARFRVGRYLALRWRQILGSLGSTVGAYALLVVTDSLDPLNALAAGAAADQIIDRFVGFLSRRRRPQVPEGEHPSDVTVIVSQMTGEQPVANDDTTDVR